MKVLLDECLPLDLRHHFPGHEAHTVQWAGFKGLLNGKLLRAAELAGYQVLATADPGLYYQLATSGRRLAIVVVRAYTNQMDDLLPLVPGCLTRSRRFGLDKTVVVSLPGCDR